MNIVIINNFARFPGTPRWDMELVRYEDFICHSSNQVSYIVNRRGRSAVLAPVGSHRLYELDDLSDVAAYHAILSEIIAQHGPIDKLIAMSEFLLDVAAQLRVTFSIPGITPEENRLGRDKLLMKQKVSEHGLRVPQYMGVSAKQVDEAIQFAEKNAYPLILKPIDGAASAGVKIIEDEVQLRNAVSALGDGHWDLEEFISGDLLHIDGLLDANGQVSFIVPSRYVNNCLDFVGGAPLGAIMLQPGTELHTRACEFATQCLTALGIKACPFHLEVFHTTKDSLVFLEVGARVAGADVPYMIHKNTGVNLFKEWMDLIMGQNTQVKAEQNGIGAWLMFPRPSSLPARIDSVTSFIGKLPSLYRELVPTVGELVVNDGGYCSMQSGRFLFSADSTDVVMQDVQHILREFAIASSSATANDPT